MPPKIQNHHIRTSGRNQAAGFRTGVRHDDVIVVGFQHGPEEIPDAFIILHYQYPVPNIHRLGLPPWAARTPPALRLPFCFQLSYALYGPSQYSYRRTVRSPCSARSHIPLLLRISDCLEHNRQDILPDILHQFQHMLPGKYSLIVQNAGSRTDDGGKGGVRISWDKARSRNAVSAAAVNVPRVIMVFFITLSRFFRFIN